MRSEVVIALAEDDSGHASLIIRNLKRVGIGNKIIHFKDGQELLDFFLQQRDDGPQRSPGIPYLLLLDLRMPKIDGLEVLRQIKQDDELRKIPVIMITTNDDPKEINICHSLGCSSYIVKPVDYCKFIEAMRRLGLFLMIVEVPKVNGGV
jgi:CheY-like chemotaxis protein